MAPQTTKQWVTTGRGGWEKDLKLEENVPIPELGERDVLVKMHAASVNYRDLIMVKGMYLYAQRIGAVQGSDGAGEVAAVGSKVTRFAPGDKVVTIFHQGHIFGTPRPEALSTGLGGALDGVFRQHGVFDEEGLVALPRNLSYLEGSTLPCAAVSAWNSLYGLPGRVLKAGDWVLVQGSGGVSVFALQFAKAAGARVVATTSTAEKVEKLKRIGADHVVNYKEDTNWGETVRKLTGGEGVQHVVEVGGPATINQSFKAIALDGNISLVGFLAGYESEKQTFMDCLTHHCSVRGIIVGSRAQFEEMNRAIEANDIHPIIGERVYGLDELKQSYQDLWDQKVFGKLCVKIE